MHSLIFLYPFKQTATNHSLHFVVRLLHKGWVRWFILKGMPQMLTKPQLSNMFHLLNPPIRWPWMTLSCPVRVCTVPWPSGRSTWGLPSSASHEQPPSTCVILRERPSTLRIRCSQVRRKARWWTLGLNKWIIDVFSLPLGIPYESCVWYIHQVIEEVLLKRMDLSETW